MLHVTLRLDEAVTLTRGDDEIKVRYVGYFGHVAGQKFKFAITVAGQTSLAQMGVGSSIKLADQAEFEVAPNDRARRAVLKIKADQAWRITRDNYHAAGTVSGR